ncbi:phosphoribosylanthranilate isomerase [Anaerobutyricum hallii]|uniref:N-(5'-phosphoribosyl)anthranilate isomerase n=1 Tax=Anaerobutyricum hallii TaxID=39488 RepID=A0A374NR03_9FIRM|nr:phosphoribosylanthranilate isomerase [Anaerobutyricum hallii]RGI89047.1 phosphoribosylanthranilate isomerase [Anaerobutyricum hallii]
MTKIKICGMTCDADIEAVNTYLPDYIGFVLFFPKSKRNISIGQAKQLLEKVDEKIETVAVVVSPTTEQVKQIEEVGFNYIQIHGTVTDEVYEQCKLPILRAFNVSDLDKLEEYEAKDKIKGYVFDSETPGSGKTFDWSLLDDIRQKQKTVASNNDVSNKDTKKMIFLAGGIDETNVKRAISEVAPDVIDLSSAVEKTSDDETFYGKDPEKIRIIVTMVHG